MSTKTVKCLLKKMTEKELQYYMVSSFLLQASCFFFLNLNMSQCVGFISECHYDLERWLF